MSEKKPSELAEQIRKALRELIASRPAKLREKWVQAILSDGSGFKDMASRAETNLGSLTDPNERTQVHVYIDKLREEFQREEAKGPVAKDVEERYRHKLAYFVPDLLGERGAEDLLGK